ncbi:hypothetical protein [Rickettsiella endosymbiont of Miltochrista miniata]|uniref:hypothetical protein n=1 Tax=Rickettsiella endosymbiont of Miltochrista miniata TaxID=3066239 RepID=UPI00313AA6A5
MEKNKKILNKFKKNLPGKALVFSPHKAFRKRFIRFVYRRYKFPVYALKDKSLLKNELNSVPYLTIFLDVDSIFFELDEILNKIHAKFSKNKETLIYLITSSKENSSKLRKINMRKRIILLMEGGKEIEYSIGGQKMPPLETPINSSPEECNNAC